VSAPVWIAVAAIGGVAALLRLAVGGTIAWTVRSELPLGTLAVNTSASLALGLLSGFGVGGTALVLAGSAAIGSYSTFSTWIFETRSLVERAAVRAAALNLLLSVGAGLGGVALGRAIGAALAA